jgi:hypothetical protein
MNKSKKPLEIRGLVLFTVINPIAIELLSSRAQFLFRFIK